LNTNKEYNKGETMSVDYLITESVSDDYVIATYYYDDTYTNKKAEIWHNGEGKYHREDGPAYIGYYEGGQVESERWCLNGERHRKDGPAYIDYYEDGRVSHEEWHLNGKRLSNERFKQLKLEIEADRCIEEMLNG
jgi:SLT domain-containing protein